MSAQPPEYTIRARRHIDKWDNALGQTVGGWDILAHWTRTGTILPVFVPDEQYNPTNIDALIRQAGYLDDEIARLGGSGS